MSEQKTKHWYQLEKGDLLRNKHDGQMVIVLSQYTKFFQDRSHWGSDIDYGVAGTAVHIQWIDGGQQRTFQKSKMKRNWEIVSTESKR